MMYMYYRNNYKQILPLEVTIHHRNSNPLDNRRCNLEGFKNSAGHEGFHARLREWRQSGGEPPGYIPKESAVWM